MTQTVSSTNLYVNIIGQSSTTPFTSYSFTKYKPLFIVGLGCHLFDKQVEVSFLFKHLQGINGSSESLKDLTESNAKIFSSNSLVAQMTYIF